MDVDTGEWTTIADMDSLSDVSVVGNGASDDGVLWFGTNESGLKRYDSGRWETFTTEDGLPSNRVQVISLAQDGTVWIGTPAGAAFRDANGQWRIFAEREDCPIAMWSISVLLRWGNMGGYTRRGCAVGAFGVATLSRLAGDE